ncbi:unnamed protein product, partial [Mesorhabditis spiculigera]
MCVYQPLIFFVINGYIIEISNHIGELEFGEIKLAVIMTTVAREEPYAAVLETPILPTLCSGCFKINTDLSPCNKCKTVYYCSHKCRASDAAEHQTECAALIRVKPHLPSSAVRLMARIFWKLDRERVGECAPTGAAFNGRTFDNLMEHADEIRKDEEACGDAYHLSSIVTQYVGNDVMRNSVGLITVFGKVRTNSFSILGEDLSEVGAGLYLGLAVHDHSCTPDAFVLFDGKKALLRVPKTGAVYSPDLRICYVDMMQKTSDRRKKLEKPYYFTCTCALCTDSQRDALALSTKCERCQTGACPLDERKDQLVCKDCGQPQKLTVEEALRLNQQLHFMISHKDSTPLASMDLGHELATMAPTYDKFAKILSPLNMDLAVYGNRLLTAAYLSGRTDILEKYAFVTVRAYKEYLPLGHPELSARLLLAAEAASCADYLTQDIVNIIDDAFGAYVVSHGRDHPSTQMAEHMLVNVKTRLQNQEDC